MNNLRHDTHFSSAAALSLSLSRSLLLSVNIDTLCSSSLSPLSQCLRWPVLGNTLIQYINDIGQPPGASCPSFMCVCSPRVCDVTIIEFKAPPPPRHRQNRRWSGLLGLSSASPPFVRDGNTRGTYPSLDLGLEILDPVLVPCVCVWRVAGVKSSSESH